jgi:hypothetical protein
MRPISAANSYLEEILFFDHPSGRERISMAMQWKAAQIQAAGDVPQTADRNP